MAKNNTHTDSLCLSHVDQASIYDSRFVISRGDALTIDDWKWSTSVAKQLLYQFDYRVCSYMVKTLRVRLLAALALALLLDPALVAAVQSVEFCHKGKEKIKGGQHRLHLFRC